MRTVRSRCSLVGSGKSQVGFSLIEFMVVMGVMAILAYGITDLIIFTQRGTNASIYGQERTMVHEEIRQQLSVVDNCNRTLSVLGNLNAPAGESKTIPLTQILDRNGNELFGVNRNPIGMGRLVIRDMNLVVHGTDALSTAELIISYDSTLGRMAPSGHESPRAINIRLERNTASGAVARCLSQAMMSDGIWRRQNNAIQDIGFMGGLVGVGTLSPASELDVRGRIVASNNIETGATVAGTELRTTGGHIVTNAPNGALVLNAGPASAGVESGIHFRSNATLGNPNAYRDLMVLNSQGQARIIPAGTTLSGLPAGWGGGLQTWDVYANGSIGVGVSDSPQALLTRDGDGLFTRNVHIGGNVGVGAPSPQAKLDVAGEIKVSASGAGCSGANQGAIRYNAGNARLEFCDGSTWRIVPTSSDVDNQINTAIVNQPVTLGRSSCSWHYWDTPPTRNPQTSAGGYICPTGQYAAGIAGAFAPNSSKKIEGWVYCCNP